MSIDRSSPEPSLPGTPLPVISNGHRSSSSSSEREDETPIATHTYESADLATERNGDLMQRRESSQRSPVTVQVEPEYATVGEKNTDEGHRGMSSEMVGVPPPLPVSLVEGGSYCKVIKAYSF